MLGEKYDAEVIEISEVKARRNCKKTLSCHVWEQKGFTSWKSVEKVLEKKQEPKNMHVQRKMSQPMKVCDDSSFNWTSCSCTGKEKSATG